MSAEEPKAVVELVGDDLFNGRTPSGHVVVIDTDRERNSASSPMELLLVALGSCTGVDVVPSIREAISGWKCIISSPVATFQSAQWPRQSNSRNKNTVASPQH